MQNEDDVNPAVESLQRAFKIRKPKEAEASNGPQYGGLVKKKSDNSGGYLSALMNRREKADKPKY